MPLATLVNEQTSSDALLWLIEVSDPASNMVLRGVNNLEDVTYNGQTYVAFPFSLTLPPETGERIQNVQLEVANTSQELVEVIRKTLEPPKVKLLLVIADYNANVVSPEKVIDFMQVANVEYDAVRITFTLAPSNIFQRRTINATYNQYECPGLFYGI